MCERGLIRELVEALVPNKNTVKTNVNVVKSCSDTTRETISLSTLYWSLVVERSHRQEEVQAEIGHHQNHGVLSQVQAQVLHQEARQHLQVSAKFTIDLQFKGHLLQVSVCILSS